MDTRVYEALLQACQELIKGSRQGVEGLDTAPHIRHLAQLAIGSASEGSRRAVADLDRRMAADQKPRFWTWGVPHAQLGLWLWRD
jgi:hypothetical protein